MKPKIVTLVIVTLIVVSSACGLDAREKRMPYPKATPPPPASPIFTPSNESAPTEAQIERDAREHNANLQHEIERALESRNPGQREAAFTFLLPELIQVAPERVVAMVAHQGPGEARNILREEVARQWITRDRDAAIKWMKSLEDKERRESANNAVASLAHIAPEQAIFVADQFGIGRD